MAGKGEAGGETSACGGCGMPAAIVSGGSALTLKMDEDNQSDINQIEARSKEAFADGTFTAYRKLTVVRRVGWRAGGRLRKHNQAVGRIGWVRGI